jgi:hypothetical protein
VNDTLIVALVFFVLLVIERRRRRRSIRIACVALALVLLFVYQPNYGRSARRALDLPRSERVLQYSDGTKLPEYMSGVRTMERESAVDDRWGLGPRLLCTLVLTWLACTPLFRGAGSSPAPRQD